MSQENVEIVRRMYEAFHNRDADAALSYFGADVLVDASRGRPDVGVGRGREQVNALVGSWITAWDEWHEEIEEMRGLGSRVLVVSLQRGRSKGTGAEVEARYAVLYDVHRGEIVGMRLYGDLKEAREAAGLPE
jgi:ketosteroid isomerase-like protein